MPGFFGGQYAKLFTRHRWNALTGKQEGSMARRRKTSVLEDIFEIAAMLPWWIGASLAVIGVVAQIRELSRSLVI